MHTHIRIYEISIYLPNLPTYLLIHLLLVLFVCRTLTNKDRKL